MKPSKPQSSPVSSPEFSSTGTGLGKTRRLGKFFRLLGFSIGGLLAVATMFTYVGLRVLNAQLEVFIERNLSQALEVPVTVEAMRIKPFQTGLDLSGLVIANPPNFSEQALLRVERAKIRFILSSLGTETIEFSQVEISGLQLRWEQQQTTSNVITLINQINAQSSGNEPPTNLEIPVFIDHLRIDNSQVTAQLDVLGTFGFEQALPIPEIALEDIDVDNLATQLIPTILNILRDQILPWFSAEPADPPDL